MANSITGLSAQKEQQFQELMLIRMAYRYEKIYARDIYTTMVTLAKYPNNTGKQAEILAIHGQNINKILQREYDEAFELFGRRLGGSIEKANNSMELKFNIPKTDRFDREKNLWIIQNASSKVTQIAGTTDEQAMDIINGVLAQAVREGMGEKETSKLLLEEMRSKAAQLSSFRSRMISRTEGHAASQASQDIMAQSMEIPLKKQWVASGGERTRDTHRDASGQVVGLNEKFKVGRSTLAYPGDPSGSAEEVINCRCVSIYI